MPDQRSELEKKLDSMLGLPLYYCAECKRAVKVTPIAGAEPKIERPCGASCGEQIIAPRKAIAVGQGGMNMSDRVKTAYWGLAAMLTGRCV